MSNKITIELNNIHCNSTSEKGHDEVYIKYSVDGGRETRFPSNGYHSMANGDNWNPALIVSYATTVVISLYDEDTLGDEFLGSHTYTVSDPQPETVPVSNTNGASYTLSTELTSAVQG